MSFCVPGAAPLPLVEFAEVEEDADVEVEEEEEEEEPELTPPCAVRKRDMGLTSTNDLTDLGLALLVCIFPLPDCAPIATPPLLLSLPLPLTSAVLDVDEDDVFEDDDDDVDDEIGDDEPVVEAMSLGKP